MYYNVLMAFEEIGNPEAELENKLEKITDEIISQITSSKGMVRKIYNRLPDNIKTGLSYDTFRKYIERKAKGMDKGRKSRNSKKGYILNISKQHYFVYHVLKAMGISYGEIFEPETAKENSGMLLRELQYEALRGISDIRSQLDFMTDDFLRNNKKQHGASFTVLYFYLYIIRTQVFKNNEVKKNLSERNLDNLACWLCPTAYLASQMIHKINPAKKIFEQYTKINTYEKINFKVNLSPNFKNITPKTRALIFLYINLLFLLVFVSDYIKFYKPKIYYEEYKDTAEAILRASRQCFEGTKKCLENFYDGNINASEFNYDSFMDIYNSIKDIFDIVYKQITDISNFTIPAPKFKLNGSTIEFEMPKNYFIVFNKPLDEKINDLQTKIEEIESLLDV